MVSEQKHAVCFDFDSFVRGEAKLCGGVWGSGVSWGASWDTATASSRHVASSRFVSSVLGCFRVLWGGLGWSGLVIFVL